MLKIAASLLGAEAPPRPAAPLAPVLPFSPPPAPVTTRATALPPPPSEPTRRVAAPEDLNAWASRPWRTAAASEPERPPAPPPAKPSRRPLAWSAAAGAALGLFLLGVWLARPPQKPRTIEPPRPRPVALPASLPAAARAVPFEPATSVTPADITPAPPPVETAPAPARRVRETRAPVPLRPMRPGDMILRGHPGVQPPEIRRLPAYAYPAAARGSGRRVALLVAVLVDENGQVMEARIRERGRSVWGFEEAALSAARKARYFPATRNGIAGKMWTDLLLEFVE